MKKILALTAVIILALGCDDGDISFKSFNFSSITTVSTTCEENNLYYKINGTEVLILEISPSELYNIESEFDDNEERTPREVTISTDGTNKITYRNYNGDVGSDNICNTSGLPATSPNVIEEWTGDGTILIETEKDFNNGKLVGYNHYITLKEITYSNSGEDIRIVNNYFGAINRVIGFSFSYGDEEAPVVIGCDDTANDRVYKTSGNDVLILNFPADTFVNEVGTLPVIEFSAEEEDYELLFKVYSGTANSLLVCDLDTTIDINQRWRASSGTCIIVTAESDVTPGEFRHEIRLKDVEFTRTDITSGETFTIYEVLSVENADDAEENGGFLLGTYVTDEE
ncbi:hypothetical protein DVK85_09370 [Flavobacterium arcticum]|uniref:Uncharacterized protein n=1 Tax=Flavobacterium arcticum TaxID=1784713 RepID=A0A345HCX0_9FLAO|nr:hypothetical protein [Flavobacterium arcticum]AXG74430.1 hypothetical protein DVK85_09370 [Flavobacterium arcticum]KAF2512449.1 hypothetical protein E0W72_04295 [Flavobacterium arcticum]